MDLALSSYNTVRLTVDKIDAAELEIYRLFFYFIYFLLHFLFFFIYLFF